VARQLTRDEAGHTPDSADFDADNIAQWGVSWLQPTPTNSENARGFVRALGGDWYDEAYGETLITQEPALALFRMFQEMRCVDQSLPSPALELGQGDPFRQGLTAMAVSFHVMDFFCREEQVAFQYDVTFLPGGPGGQFVPVGCSGWAIPAQSENKEGAWELVKYLTSEPVQREIGRIKRWGVSRQGAIDEIIPENAVSGFAKVHTAPLKGESDREVISFKFPPNQSRIKEIYATNFDPLWTCDSVDVAGAAEATKQEVDGVLAGS